MMSDDRPRDIDDGILEPLTAFKTKYRDAFRKNCEEYFDDLVKKSGIGVEENRKTVAAYDAQQRLAAEAERLSGKRKCEKVLLIVGIVIGVALLLASVVCFVSEALWVGVGLICAGALSVVLFSVLLFRCVLPSLRRSMEREAELKEKAEELYSRAWRQMEPLNALFEGDVTKALIEKTVPLLRLDENFNVRRYDYLSGKYGYGADDDEAASTVGILTGEICGNPFVADRQLVCTMGYETYTGYLEIFWETVEHDSEGRPVVVHHSETLTASVTRPKPFYRKETRLIYGNEAAPDLHFSRRPAHAENDSEKKRARKIKSGAKSVRKRQNAAIESGGSFTELGNTEFEVLFGALDRDNEVQFRLLFTPLAQKNLLSLMTDRTDGFGDDFYLKKTGCLNYVVSEHSAQWEMEEDAGRYRSYAADLARSKFLAFNEQYFRSLYFDLAPLLSIPLYQQHKPHEYIYHESYPRHFTRQQTEYAVNHLDEGDISPAGAVTPSILKTCFLRTDGGSDRVRVTANAYRAVEQTEFVSVFGGDGHFHAVPVEWTEYIPISSDTDVELKELGLSERAFRREVGSGAFRAAMEKHAKGAYGYRHGILCCAVPEDGAGFDADFTKKN